MFKSCLIHVAFIYVTCYRTVFDKSFQKLTITFDENIFDLEFSVFKLKNLRLSFYHLHEVRLP